MSALRWNDLPAELCLVILEEVEDTALSKLEGHSLVAYTLVSNEWRVFFEEITFCRLVLSSDELDDFERIVTRRRLHETPISVLPVDHIWLRLLLPEYHCLDCRKPETEAEVTNNDIMFTNAMWKFFGILTLLGSVAGRKGLTLEFSAHSPSDSEHIFKSWHQLQPDYPHFTSRAEQYKYIREKSVMLGDDDDAHGYGTKSDRRKWVRNLLRGGQQMRCEYAQRLVRPLKFNFRDITTDRKAGMARWLTLAKASSVAELLIRRQHFRDIETASLSWLLRSLPSLESLRRETWRPITNTQRRVDDRRYALRVGTRLSREKQDKWRFLLTTNLPTSLTHLHLFEDFEIQLHGRQDVVRPRLSRIELLPSLAVSTPKLQCLSISFLTDAIDCFGLRQFYLKEDPLPENTTFHFPHIEFVVLTSQEHLNQDQDHYKINAFLRAAAAVALKMPKLKTMELWNCGQGQACVFRYDAADASSDRFCRLTWRSTWEPGRDLVIRADVLKAWEKVARTLAPSCSLLPEPIRCERHPLPIEYPGFEYLSYADILRAEYLKLRPYLLHLPRPCKLKQKLFYQRTNCCGIRAASLEGEKRETRCSGQATFSSSLIH